MGCLLKWKRITSEASYDTVRIYRASGEDATYGLLASQSIEDTSYYDSGGLSSYWYKIDFYSTITGESSELSDAIQGGTYSGYATVDEMRQITNLRTADISDTQLATLIEFAGTQLNNDMNIYHDQEVVEYIDATRENDLDGVNSTFYTKHYFLGDANNDFKVTTSDLIVWQVDSEGTKTKLTVTQVNAELGQFRLSTAPGSDKELYVTYVHVPRRVDTPDRLIKLGCLYLAASWAYDKINLGKATRFHMGNLTVFRDTNAGHEYYKRYLRILAAINDRTITDIEEASELF
jgi:hypothetical protein